LIFLSSLCLLGCVPLLFYMQYKCHLHESSFLLGVSHPIMNQCTQNNQHSPSWTDIPKTNHALINLHVTWEFRTPTLVMLLMSKCPNLSSVPNLLHTMLIWLILYPETPLLLVSSSPFFPSCLGNPLGVFTHLRYPLSQLVCHLRDGASSNFFYLRTWVRVPAPF
jgi:hypothetical protein